MKIINTLLGKIVAPLVVTLVAPIIIGFGSKMATGNWQEWFIAVPKQGWIILGVVIFLWISIIAIRYRLRQLHKDDSPAISIISVPYNGWINIGKLPYAGVNWMVRAPAPSELDLDPPDISPSDIELETPPRCPKCETEIEQSRSFWGGYIWKCVRCGFHKHNSESYYREEERAKKIAKRDWELRKNAQTRHKQRG